MIRTFLSLLFMILLAVNVYAEEDLASVLEKSRNELLKKEEIIKRETERLKTLKKELEEDIIKYTDLLKKIDKSIEQAEEIESKRLKHVARAYEAMSPADAAKRLSGLDNETAVQILLKMKSKKAGLVIGMMNSDKATLLTKEIAKLKK